MSFVGLVQFAVKYFVDVLAWPLFALGYPLYASVRAIEHNSVSDTQKLNTYWVVFSLILLLEHILNLLEWLLLWQYIRLMIVCWLVTPCFDGAFYVYKNLIRPCHSMDLQNVINWFNLYAKDNVFNEMEKYIKENGPEALEKIIARKSGGTLQNLDVKDIKASPSTENKEVEQKDIRPVEVLEKNEVKAPQQDSGVLPNVTRVENRNFAGPEIKKPVPGVATQRELPETPASTKGQKLICEICHIKLPCVITLNSHLQGKKHKAAVEALKAKIQSSGPKVVHNFAGPEIKKPVHKAAAQREIPQTSASGKGQKCTCEICHMKLPCVITLNSHLQGKKHKAAVMALKAKLQSSGPKVAPTDIPKNSNVPNVKPGKSGPQKEYPGNAGVRGQQQGNPASVPGESVQHWDWDWGPQKEYTGNAEVRGQQQGSDPASVPGESVQHWGWDWGPQSVQHWGWDWGPQKEYPGNAEVRRQGNPASVPRESVQHWGCDWGPQKEYPGNAEVRGQQHSNPASVPRESVQHWGWDWGLHKEYPGNAEVQGQQQGNPSSVPRELVQRWGWD